MIFDYSELLGLKQVGNMHTLLKELIKTYRITLLPLLSQVYYECFGLGDPLSLKSPGAKRLLSHLRHPVCLELAVVLWLLPSLTLDRLLLAGTLSAYVMLAHSLDKQDLAYLCVQLQRKMQLFAEPQSGSAAANTDQDDCSYKEKWGQSRPPAVIFDIKFIVSKLTLRVTMASCLSLFFLFVCSFVFSFSVFECGFTTFSYVFMFFGCFDEMSPGEKKTSPLQMDVTWIL